MALQSGLDAAILNPNAEAMMKAYFCLPGPERPGRAVRGIYRAVCGRGARGGTDGDGGGDGRCGEAIVRGLKERA